MKKLIAMLMIGMVVAGANAAVTLNVGGGVFRDHTGAVLTDGMTKDSLLMVMIADKDGDGFESLSAIGSGTGYVAGDDVLVDSFSIEWWNAIEDGQLVHAINNFDMLGNGLEAGDSLAIVWFENTLGSAMGSAPVEGEYYGFDTTKVLPADGATEAITYNFTGTDGYASNQVSAVPEPATLSLLGLGAVAMLRRRRKAA